MRTRALERATFLSIVCILLGVVALLVSFSGQEHHILSILTRDIGVLLMSLGLISALYETLIRRQLLQDLLDEVRIVLDPDTRRLGVEALYRGRDEKGNRGRSIDNLISETRHEMFCLGLGLLAFVPERQALLIERMQQGCRFKFLIFNTESDAAAILDLSLGYGNGNLLDFIRSQARFVLDFQKRLITLGLADRFEARVYDVVPTFGMIELDRGQKTCRLVVELYGYNAEGSVCPGFSLIDADEGWSSFFRERADHIWKNSKPLLPPRAYQSAAGPAETGKG